MKVYIRVIDKDSGRAAWFNEDSNGDQYLMDGWCIYGSPAYYNDWLRGTPFTSIKAIKKAKKDADILASWDSWETKVELWKETSRKFIPVKLNQKTNKLENLDPKKFRDPEKEC